MQIHNDVLLDMPELLQGSNRLVLLLSFIVKSCLICFDFILFLALNTSIYNLSSYASAIATLSQTETF